MCVGCIPVETALSRARAGQGLDLAGALFAAYVPGVGCVRCAGVPGPGEKPSCKWKRPRAVRRHRRGPYHLDLCGVQLALAARRGPYIFCAVWPLSMASSSRIMFASRRALRNLAFWYPPSGHNFSAVSVPIFGVSFRPRFESQVIYTHRRCRLLGSQNGVGS